MASRTSRAARAGILATALALTAVAAAQKPAPFTVDVPVLVLDHHGEPLLQLDQDLFRLSDNGRPQRLSGFDGAVRPVSLAIVIDAHDPNALAQAKRSAELVAAMVMGAAGEASVYVAGPEPRQVLAFTRDHDLLANTLRHLARTPTAPLGHGRITEPANLAVLDLTHRPATQTRAVLIIGKSADRDGAAANALVEDALENAISIFRISPQPLDGATPAANPDTVAVGGSGQGSQRDPNILPSDARPGMPGAANTDQAIINLNPVPRAALHVAGAVVAPHVRDYVYDSGGLTLGAGDNADFDRKLSSIGADLRSLYHLYYHPDDLGAPSRRHRIAVAVLASHNQVGNIEYRRAYLSPRP